MKNKIVLFIFIVIVILSSLFTIIYASSINRTEVLANEDEWEVIKEVNKERVNNGLLPLSVTSGMMDAAGQRVEELVELYSYERPNGKYAHTILDDFNISYNTFSQCIAESINESKGLTKQWLDHDKDGWEILNIKYTHVGVGGYEETGMWALLMSGTCAAYNVNAIYDANKTYPPGTAIEDFETYLILNCADHGRSYVPIISEMVSGYDSTALGTQTLTVTYGDLYVNFDVTIADDEKPSETPSEAPSETPPETPSESPSSTPPPPPPPPTPSDSVEYTDVKADSWYADAVYYVTGAGLFTGTSASNFSPEVNLTRSMFVTVLGRLSEMLGEDVSGYSCTFRDIDIKSGSWYYKYVCWAADKGIVTGYNKDTFGPNDNITREQMAAIFTRYAESISIKLFAGEAKFTDNSKISSWAKYSVGVANASGLIQGYTDGSFRPLEYATRAQAATIFQRFMLNYL